jgi:lipoprotein-anchoring transpeptidase ErfK/SrfK
MFRWTLGLAALAIGCAVPAAEAVAQYYPPYAYPAQPPGYRVVPPPVDPDDDDDVVATNRPGEYRGPYQARPYPSAPPIEQANPDSRRYPGERYGRVAPPYGEPDPYGVPRPPVGILPEGPGPRPYGYPPGYGRPQPYGYPPQQQDAGAQPGYSPQPGYGGGQPGYGAPRYGAPQPPAATGRDDQRYAALPPDYQPEEGAPKELSPELRRQMVDYRTREPAGTVVIDTPNTYLYLVLGNGKALRYGIGVGREGFTWAGEERISKMSEWPDWHPPAEMIERQRYLPRFMAGGPGNPLGARALYLFKSLYRIHGTNQPSTIGQFVSSGCIRLLNEDIEDLYSRINVGTRIVVLAGGKPATAAR